MKPFGSSIAFSLFVLSLFFFSAAEEAPGGGGEAKANLLNAGSIQQNKEAAKNPVEVEQLNVQTEPLKNSPPENKNTENNILAASGGVQNEPVQLPKNPAESGTNGGKGANQNPIEPLKNSPPNELPKSDSPPEINNNINKENLLPPIPATANNDQQQKPVKEEAPADSVTTNNNKLCEELKIDANILLEDHPIFGLLMLQLNRQKQHQKFVEKPEQHTEPINARYFNQWLDHFAPRTKIFKQRYFMNDAFRAAYIPEAENSVVKNILFIGGPNGLTANSVMDEALPHVAMGKKYNASLWALEHRFYGASQPHGGGSVANLHWLTSDQALEDIAHFIRAKNVEILQVLNITAENIYKRPKLKWILFSHSTPLALWFCQKYADEYCSGVVASSAAVTPALSFFQYEKHVEDAFATVGGQACANQLAVAVLNLRQLVQSVEGRERLSTVLSLRPAFGEHESLHYRDFQHFFAMIATIFQAAAQYNDIPSLGISKICQKMEENKDVDSLLQIAKLLELYRLYSPQEGMPNDYRATVEKLRDDKLGSPYINARMWLWQSCTEFGYHPTSDHGGGWFGASIPNNFYLDLCSDVFGELYDISSLDNGIERTIHLHGPGIYAGKNALLTHGQFDPWRSVRVQHALHPESVRFVEIAGASHAADFLPYYGAAELIGGEKNCVIQRPPPVLEDLQRVASNSPVERGGQRPAIQNARDLIAEHVALWFLEPELIKSGSSLDPSPVSSPSLNKELVEKEPHPQHYHQQRSIRKRTARVEFDPKPINVKNEIAALFASRDEPQGRGLFGQRRTFTEQMEQKLIDAFQGQALALDEGAHIQKGRILQVKDHFAEHRPDPDETGSVTIEEFNDTKKATTDKEEAEQYWTQYFYRNDQHWKKPKGPAFLIIGGEGSINSHWVLNYWQSSVWAAKFGADLYALEHRFYGDSLPTAENYSTPNLKLLTAEQALADTAVFIRSMNEKFNYGNWVVFGGSYAGNLAAWFRQKYPELAIGAIASSAPVLTQVDYFEYKQIVQNSVKRYGTHGCADNIETFFTLLQKAYQSKEGRKMVAKALNLCDDETSAGWYGKRDYVDDHDYWLMGDTFGDNSLSTVVQYDDQGTVPEQNHRRLIKHCRTFEMMKEFPLPEADSKIDWEKAGNLLLKIAKALNMDTGEDGKCQHIAYQKDIEKRRNIEAGGWRTWFWQTCNEFGFFQTTNWGRNIFESAVPINLLVDTCSDVFGAEIDRDYIEERSAWMNEFYGGRDNFNGTNVVFLNGSEDPWHYNSIIDEEHTPNPTVKAVLAEGTSHCADMLSERDYDVPQLKHARAVAEAELTKWLTSPSTVSKTE